MDLKAPHVVEYRKRAWDQQRTANDAFSSPKRSLGEFNISPWLGLTGGIDEIREYSKAPYLHRWASNEYHYDIDPFIPADEETNPVTQDIWINTYGPLGKSSILGDGRLVFSYQGIDVLRRVARDDPYGTVEQVTDDEVFVKGFRMKKGDHAYREELISYLTPDYHAASNLQSGLVTCVTLSDLKAYTEQYASRVRQLRCTVSAPKAEKFALADHQRTIYGWSRPTTANGGSQAAAGVESLLALCVRPQDLYDLFRPLGVCFSDKKKIDAEVDMVTLLSCGTGNLLIPFMDDTLCKKGSSAPFTLWLVYRQKTANVVACANAHLDNYPDVDLVITDKPTNAFLDAFISNEGNASYSSRDNPREKTPFIFRHVATTMSRFYPNLDDETRVFVTLACQSKPIIVFPSRLKCS